ncbi:asparagine synthase (glutamine-hydrolyzing) [Candidatus Parcubacteria bacterium]|nr:asparagine synthase (glutamine-hydrolyzing) [Candidatus Parcubacteria bacterium]
MCGIAGFVGQGTQENLNEMLERIRHRGPDDQGIYFGRDVGLAHARLSIIDISAAGHQPMWNQRHTVAVVFNGEIYNFQMLRDELVADGYPSTNKTDTEVILYMYEKYGNSCFEKLEGMFAIALYDAEKGKLLLARDRMGKKPLYWTCNNRTIIFASELKSLLVHPYCERQLSIDNLRQYLLYEYIPTPATIFEKVYKLESGTYIIYEHGIITKKRYWSPSASEFGGTFEEARRILTSSIEKSVAERLIADVPLGVFLSGGLDSSTIAYFAQRVHPKKIKTFSIGFDEASFDESRYASDAARYLGTEHYSKKITAKECLETLPHILKHLDEPLADASIIPTHLLSQFVRQHVTVALSGDGGDELFAGYPTFQAEKIASIYGYAPSKGKLFLNVLDTFGASEKNFSRQFQFKKFIDGYDHDPVQRHMQWLGSFSNRAQAELFLPDVWEKIKHFDIYASARSHFDEIPYSDIKNKLLYMYQKTYMMDGVLAKVDRASMMEALEVRSPLLDRHIVEFANSLPYHFKLRGLTTKYILKEAMSGVLPKSNVWRKKKGFGIPLARWLKNELKVFCEEVLSESEIKRLGLFNYAYIERLKKDHFDGRVDNRKLIWTLIVFHVWYRNFLENT